MHADQPLCISDAQGLFLDLSQLCIDWPSSNVGLESGRSQTRRKYILVDSMVASLPPTVGSKGYLSFANWLALRHRMGGLTITTDN